MKTSNCLALLTQAGLTCRKINGRLRVEPACRLTDDLRRYILQHKAELLAELGAANDPLRVVIHYHLTDGKGGTMASNDGTSRADNVAILREMYGARLLDDLDILAEGCAEMAGQSGYD